MPNSHITTDAIGTTPHSCLNCAEMQTTIYQRNAEIARLEAENATLRQRLADVNAALAPFAHYGKAMNYDAPIADGVLRTPVVEPRFPEKDSPRLLCGDFKRAILAWTPKENR